MQSAISSFLMGLVLLAGCPGTNAPGADSAVPPPDASAADQSDAGDGGTALPDGSTCDPCPMCAQGEICCGAGGMTDFAPTCLKLCTTSNDCQPGEICLMNYGTCAGQPGAPRVCLRGIHLCPGVPAQCQVCGCDVFLGGDRVRCDGPDAKSRPYQVDPLRICGFRIDPCRGCKDDPVDGGVKCQFP